MELKYLNTFKAILETGSFQKAAERLNYAQSTITLQMQLLEQELSVKLFEKIGRKMALTQAGKELTPYIDNILNAVQQMESHGRANAELTGTLRVAMPETLLSYQMVQPLMQFRQKAPHVRLSLQALNCYEISMQVLGGGIDLGVHYDFGGDAPSLVTQRLQPYVFILVGSPQLGEKEADFITPNQKKALCLLADQSSCYYKKLTAYLRTVNITIDNEVDLISTEAVKRLVKGNLGIAYLPRFTVEEELNTGAVQEIPTAIQNKQVGTVCRYHKNKWISPAMDLFLRLLHAGKNVYSI